MYIWHVSRWPPCKYEKWRFAVISLIIRVIPIAVWSRFLLCSQGQRRNTTLTPRWKQLMTSSIMQSNANVNMYQRLLVQMAMLKMTNRDLCMTNVFWRFLLHFTLHFRHSTDPTQVSLRNFRYSRWPPANGSTIQISIILVSYLF